MQDMKLTFNTRFWLGRRHDYIHLWQEDEQTFFISVNIGAEEIFVLKILNDCTKIQITKDKREELLNKEKKRCSA